MNSYRELCHTIDEVCGMTEAEVLVKYRRGKTEYLAELNARYDEWREHFASMFD